MPLSLPLVFKRMNRCLPGLLMVAALLFPVGLATELPPGVINYLKARDPNVKIRFDGLILFSNGESYVPVIPQDPALSPDSQQVIMSVPEHRAFPDLVEFDNHFFLIRLIQTSSGRLTFPKLDEYPLQLKEGLLPQDFVLPNNLFIPVELKIILGGLPYNPTYTPVEPGKLPPTPQTQLKHTPVPPKKQMSGALYVFDLTNQRLLSLNPSGKPTAEVSLDCVPSSLRLSADGKLLFAPCLNTNELAVVDTVAGLVKTRITVGERPESVLYLNDGERVLVSHRFSDFISVVNGQTLLPGEKIPLPGSGGPMAPVPPATGQDKVSHVVVASAFKPEVYLVNLDRYEVAASWPVLPDSSALWVSPPTETTGPQLWVASRSKHKVQVLDLETGRVLNTFEVGAKPVDFGVYEDKLYVVSAGSDRLDVIDWKNKQLLTPIVLMSGSFPSNLVVSPEEGLAYLTAAGSPHLFLLDLKSNQVHEAMNTEFRSGAAALSGHLGMPAFREPGKILESLPEIREVKGPAPGMTPPASPSEEATVTLDALPTPVGPSSTATRPGDSGVLPAMSMQGVEKRPEKKPGKKWFGGRKPEQDAPTEPPPMMESLPAD